MNSYENFVELLFVQCAKSWFCIQPVTNENKKKWKQCPKPTSWKQCSFILCVCVHDKCA